MAGAYTLEKKCIKFCCEKQEKFRRTTEICSLRAEQHEKRNKKFPKVCNTPVTCATPQQQVGTQTYMLKHTHTHTAISQVSVQAKTADGRRALQDRKTNRKLGQLPSEGSILFLFIVRSWVCRPHRPLCEIVL